MVTHGRNQHTKKYIVCNYCGEHYQKGFMGSGFKYCSKVCSNDARNKYYKERYKRIKKNCKVCRRDIHSVGLRKQANKYCSRKCLQIAQGMRDNGQTMMKIEIPIKYYYKLFDGGIE